MQLKEVDEVINAIENRKGEEQKKKQVSWKETNKRQTSIDGRNEERKVEKREKLHDEKAGEKERKVGR